MIVYRIRHDVDRYRQFLVDDDTIWETNVLWCDCTSRKDGWLPPKVWVPEPKLLVADFYSLTPGALVTAPRATELLRHQLEWDKNELLPLEYRGEHFTVTNILLCWDCLDEGRSEWEYGERSGKRLAEPKKYAFHKDRLPEAPLFKIPQTCRAYIYCVEGMLDADPEDNWEFKLNVERHNLKGLIFEKVWEG